MNPEEALADCIRVAVESVPQSYIDGEPENAWNDIAAHFVVAMAQRGIYFK